jgi:HD-GYP domain-containing protein (c-di-GMP phosphodiesterase class II)
VPRRRTSKDDEDRLKSVAGETSDEIVLPSARGAETTMPACRRDRYVSIPAAAPLGDDLDVDTVMAVLDSHAQVSGVRLAILLPDGAPFFEATPPEAKGGGEHEVALVVPGRPGLAPDGRGRFARTEGADPAGAAPLRLRGALPARQLRIIADALERALALRASSGAQRQLLEAERQRLSLIFEFSEKVCKLSGFDDIVGRFLRDVTRILEAREGTYFALDPRRKDLYIRCHWGGDPEVERSFRLKVGEGISGAVAADGMPRIVNDVESCPDYVPKTNPIRNIIAAPVLIRGKIVGVVNVNDRASGEKPFSNRDLQLLVSLARLGGVALENVKLYSEIRGLLLALIESLSTAIDAKDRFALGHSQRVAFLAERVGRRLELGEQELDMLHVAALLHDIGNLAVPETVLKKEGPLSERERAQVKEHPALGASILSPVEQLSAVLPGIMDHHERYDGRGYPRHLKGGEISLQGRVLAIVDAYDAMTHERSFRDACTASEALAEITSQAGAQFDPALVGVFVECYRELELDSTALEEHLPPSTGRGLDF